MMPILNGIMRMEIIERKVPISMASLITHQCLPLAHMLYGLAIETIGWLDYPLIVDQQLDMLITVPIIIVHMIPLMIGNTTIVTVIGLMQDKDSVFGTNVRIIFFLTISYLFSIPINCSYLKFLCPFEVLQEKMVVFLTKGRKNNFFSVI